MSDTRREELPVYEVEELHVERRVNPGKFYVEKDGRKHEHERRSHADGVELMPARKR